MSHVFEREDATSPGPVARPGYRAKVRSMNTATTGVGAALAVTCTAALACALPAVGGASAPAAHTASVCKDKNAHRQHGRFYARLYAPGHRPKVGNYPIKVIAKSPSGKPISGGYVFYQFLFGTTIVACRTVGPQTKYKPHFKRGVFRDVLTWPKKAVGKPISLRVVVRTKYGLKNLDYKILVRK
jgi:hypothetical protein